MQFESDPLSNKYIKVHFQNFLKHETYLESTVPILKIYIHQSTIHRARYITVHCMI